MVAQLRPKVKALREGKGDEAIRQGRRDERRRYIESGVRKVVGKFGEGSAEIGGERRSREDVEGLEGLVEGMETG